MGWSDYVASDIANGFLNTSDFAEAVTITPSGGAATSVNVQFDEAFQLIDPMGVNSVTTHPMALGAASDLSTMTKGDPLVRGGVTYYVTRIEHDGFVSAGMKALILSREQPHG